MSEKQRFYGPEKRVLPLFEAELRVKRADDGTKKIVGYAAKFDKMSQNLGGFVEKIDKRFFDRALKTADVRGLKNHSEHHVLGRTKSGTMELHVDDIGLRYEIKVPETQVGRDTVTEIERGDMDGSSFSFTVEDEGDHWDSSVNPPIRTLMSCRDLFDVGPVTYPAYLDTEVSCRSFDRFKESEQRDRDGARTAELLAEETRKAETLAIQRRRQATRLRLFFPSLIIPKG